MFIPNTILIVSDDDLLPMELTTALGDTLAINRIGGGDSTHEVPLTYQVMRLQGPWDLNLSEDGYDCCILALHELAGTISDAALEALLRRTRSLLVITESGTQPERRLARELPTLALVRPCTDNELRASVYRLLMAAHPRRDADATELLRRLLADRHDLIEPTVNHGGVRYLAVERHLGPEVDSRALLEQLVDHGALDRRVGARLRLCAACDDYQLIYEERCPECQSLDFELSPMLHHFPCGFVGREETFGEGEGRRCPKCTVPLLGIGRDHERIGNLMTCVCGATAPEPRVQARCLGCGQVQEPNDTREKTLSTYVVNERAEAIALEGQRTGDAVQLRDRKSGLYHRSVLVLEVDREHARSHRYNSTYTVIALSVHNLADLREHHGVVSMDYLDVLLGRCSGGLRRHDLASRWSADTAVALLPETDSDGAAIVMDRLAASIQAQCEEWLDPLPQIGLASATLEDSHRDGADVVNEAITLARREDSATISRIIEETNFVVLD